MVLERAEIVVGEDNIEELIALLETRALALTDGFNGCRTFRALRGLEHPNSIMFLVEWDSVEAHHASRQDPAHIEFRNLVLPYCLEARQTLHYSPISSGRRELGV